MAEDDAALGEDSGEGRVRDIGEDDGIAGTDEERTDNCSLHSTVVQFSRASPRCNARAIAAKMPEQRHSAFGWRGVKIAPRLVCCPRARSVVAFLRVEQTQMSWQWAARRKASDDHMPATFFLPDIMRPVVRSDIADKQTSRLQLDLHRCIRVISLPSLLSPPLDLPLQIRRRRRN